MALYGSLLGSASVWAEARLPLALPSGRHICGLAAVPLVASSDFSGEGGVLSQRTVRDARNYTPLRCTVCMVNIQIKCRYAVINLKSALSHQYIASLPHPLHTISMELIEQCPRTFSV